MNASNAFRSHLMQQFAESARSQARPPLALIGWLTDGHESSERTSTAPTSNVARRRTLSSLTANSPTPSAASYRHVSGELSLYPSQQRRLSSQEYRLPSYNLSGNSDHDEDSSSELPGLFQTLLQTRRSRNHFSAVHTGSAQYWKDALERAALCGYNAPNHKRTEPFTFKRMIAPSPKTERLAEIAYHVSLRKLLIADPDLRAAEAAAARKRDKWNQVPAFLVTLVASHTPIVETASVQDEDDPYRLLPYVPPTTERDLEDYASACAAVQNVLLSLHSEDIASKWVTGTVIQTPAFRELVEASSSDRVVALIMLGFPDENKKMHSLRRHKRHLNGDVLVDL